MFIFDWITSKIMEEVIDWIYSKILEFLSMFFTYINTMGSKIFDLPWIEAITTFFSYFGWSLYVVGIMVAAFDCAIEAQNGRFGLKETAINILKGFFACSLFTIVPIELYKFSVSLQGILSQDMITLFATTDVNIGNLCENLLNDMFEANRIVYNLYLMIAMGYCVIKVFFANIKRGGILLISIALGTFYMFSIPRGYTDGFTSWCKQIIGICFTAFIQTTMLIAGLTTWRIDPLLGLGIMLASSEVPRIAGQFGLDTSTKGNLMSGVYAAQSAVNVTKTVFQAVAK